MVEAKWGNMADIQPLSVVDLAHTLAMCLSRLLGSNGALFMPRLAHRVEEKSDESQQRRHLANLFDSE